MERLIAWFDVLRVQALEVWTQGGWCMPPIAGVAMLMFGLGVRTRLRLSHTGFASVRERTWRKWIDEPSARKGPVGELLDFVTGHHSTSDLSGAFKEVRTSETAPFARDLRVLSICIASAPLLGLLGTVTGMLSTFEALASGSGGEKTMALVAKGISEALITTETGLVVALPGVFMRFRLSRRFDLYKAFLAHVETVCAQRLHRRLSAGGVA
jgi:biopolymer transport protein ExbB